MAFALNDRVKETSTSIGTAGIVLDGAATGFETFSSAIGNGNVTYYAIVSQNNAEFEVGVGTVGAGTLSRDTVISSSNSDALVNFGSGTKDVFVTLPASKTVYIDDSGDTVVTSDFNITGSVTATSFSGDGASLTALNIVTDTSPQLGGNLDLNSNDITGTGNIDNVGTITTDGLTVAGNVSVDGGTIKLDGNYPVGTDNVALGDGALDDAGFNR